MGDEISRGFARAPRLSDFIVGFGRGEMLFETRRLPRAARRARARFSFSRRAEIDGSGGSP